MSVSSQHIAHSLLIANIRPLLGLKPSRHIWHTGAVFGAHAQPHSWLNTAQRGASNAGVFCDCFFSIPVYFTKIPMLIMELKAFSFVSAKST